MMPEIFETGQHPTHFLADRDEPSTLLDIGEAIHFLTDSQALSPDCRSGARARINSYHSGQHRNFHWNRLLSGVSHEGASGTKVSFDRGPGRATVVLWKLSTSSGPFC